jgi:2,4-dienoyl-CoA reductase (NADPH2)
MGLFDEVRLGGRTARNRVVFGPHETNLGQGRTFSHRHLAYYVRRADGGCGTIVTETASVHDSDWPYERAPLAEVCRPGWSAIAAALHDRGALALASLGHAGLQGSSAYSQRALWAPSRFADPASREVPMVMGTGEISTIVRAFADAAEAAVTSGLDGVELAAGPYSLLRQFLSGLTNTRDDDYGTDRSRFVREVIAAVRTRVGADVVIGLRLSCDEQAPWAGITPEASGPLAAGLADGIDYVAAVRVGPFGADAHRPDGHTPPAFAVPLAHGLRAALPPTVLVMAQGSIVDLADADAALGAADLVEMTRAQIADPDLVVKAAAGRGEEVRPCLLCNQACLVRDARNPIVSCVGEPATGHETTGVSATGSTDPVPLDVLVVGAGVCGLEAARVAALRGHHVTVVDRSDVPGGVTPLVAAGAGRDRLALLPRWLASECERLGVRAAFGHVVDDDEVGRATAAGTRVLVATGAEASPPPWLDAMALPTLAARTVLTAAHRGELGTLPDGPVLVDDPVGGPVGVSVAETLVATGRAVTLVTQDNVAGVQLSRTGDLAAANTRLAQAGVTVAKRSIVRSGDRAGVVVEDRYSGTSTVVPAALVVYAGHDLPFVPLAPHAGTVVAGDAVAPRTILEAVLEGRRAMVGLLTTPGPLRAAGPPAGQVTDDAAPVDQAMT